MEQNCPLLKGQQLNVDGVAHVSLTTMDVSCDLSNSSHFDIHGARPDFAVWTEMVPGWCHKKLVLCTPKFVWSRCLPRVLPLLDCWGGNLNQRMGLSLDGMGVKSVTVHQCSDMATPTIMFMELFVLWRLGTILLIHAHHENLKGLIIEGMTTQTAPIDKGEDSWFHDPLEHICIPQKQKSCCDHIILEWFTNVISLGTTDAAVMNDIFPGTTCGTSIWVVVGIVSLQVMMVVIGVGMITACP